MTAFRIEFVYGGYEHINALDGGQPSGEEEYWVSIAEMIYVNV